MRNDSPVQAVALVVGVVFLLVGVLGFVPGVTAHDGELAFAGHGSGAKLLDLFAVSVLHNLVHVAFGVAGLALARTADRGRAFLLWGGVGALILWLLGVANAGRWLPVNAADNWLHLGLGAGMLGLGFVASRDATAPAPA